MIAEDIRDSNPRVRGDVTITNEDKTFKGFVCHGCQTCYYMNDDETVGEHYPHFLALDEVTMLKAVNVDGAIDFLNHLLTVDPIWVTNVAAWQHVCKKELGNIDIQTEELQGGCLGAGALGLINGLFGTLGVGEKKDYGPITAVFDDNEVIIRFERTTL